MKREYFFIIIALLFVCVVYNAAKGSKTRNVMEPFHRMLRPYIRKTCAHVERNHSLAKEYISRGYRKLSSFSIY